jgi:hypothetical protein
MKNIEPEDVWLRFFLRRLRLAYEVRGQQTRQPC